MAKIVPPGANPNLGVSYEDPLDKILKLVDLGSRAVGAYNRSVQKQETYNAQGLELIHSLSSQATDSNAMQQIRNIYNQNFDSQYESSNPHYNALVDITKMSLDKREAQISNFETSSQEFANMLYSTDNTFNTNILNLGPEQIEDVFSAMNKDELGGWMKSALDARDDIVLYKSNLTDLYGTKSPDFKIMVHGQKVGNKGRDGHTNVIPGFKKGARRTIKLFSKHLSGVRMVKRLLQGM